MSFTPATDNAEIEPATIEVRTLMVDGRRMSAGFLRQLVEEPLINAAGELAGEPWGYVNHHPDKCGDDPLHVHLVWPTGGELRRARINAPEYAHFEAPAAAFYAMARILDGARDEPGDNSFRCYSVRDLRGRYAYARIRHSEVLFRATLPVAFESMWGYGSGDPGALRLAAEELRGAPLPSVDELADELTTVADASRAAWSALEDLPQLFIGG